MRTNYFYSLLFALLTSASISVIAAPASKQETASTVPAVTAVAAPQTTMVDINRADAATLQRELLGVGEVKAKAIVAYREANGAFSSVDELLEVKGIGKAILESNREKLKVN
ncbi:MULTISPECIES: ComEA family DNA-binding protein [Pseudomonas]|uniref:Competence protein ComEA helix-hairpin-helix domain-containing protein n=1 Tax=Pseudomonas chlororaphis TaxID=587753 RepID=A0AAX3FVU2_9PSED|nr:MULTISPECIES: ComEA family DNA-binding protein [Pseudomonas]AZC39006.1 Competence protein ComEA helix-hairpin-helix region precursor [Pseudomonas chlororaphis subsp. piscium]AZC45556.1 Competence protein ComEA helix-hairpin-helix region precursor [Pseudomonas chlororaphis subsp. piscium]PMY45051.1 competence protein ComEA [Pseudomonas sp. FW306-2-2C-D06C]PYC36567.1 helix-hairpin-helix domain-containing protein [Pseudomonas chlororaphis]WDG71112.1 ComEA family DNA-binding protein [Pseudomona